MFNLSNSIRKFQNITRKKIGLPFQDYLPQETILEVLGKKVKEFRERIFTPCVMVWSFLSQVLDPDKSCQKALTKIITFLHLQGETAPSTGNGGYCTARKRLPEFLLRNLAKKKGRELTRNSQATWNGRKVKVIDGTMLTMPDTPENQKVYPTVPPIGKGAGFPHVRVLCIFDLITGVILDVVLGSYLRGENALLSRRWNCFEKEDIIMGDRGFCSFCNIAQAIVHGLDAVFRGHASKKMDFRKGKALGEYDHIVEWEKPPKKSVGISVRDWNRLPERIQVREIKTVFHYPGFRPQSLTIVTTLLDPEIYPKEELVNLYGLRWKSELYLRDIKTTLGMDILRTKTPSMVRKEIYTFILAYNLLREIMAESAKQSGVDPYSMSFKGFMQFWVSISMMILYVGKDKREILNWIQINVPATIKLKNRKGRSEPRLLRKRAKAFGFLHRPRSLYKPIGSVN